jgi:hypothetical protein
MAEQLRRVQAVAAVINDTARRFFVCFNARWQQYAFPMTKRKPNQALDQTAVQAFRDHVPPRLLAANAQPTATPLEYIGAFGPSWGVDQDTYYTYDVFEVDPGQQLPAGEFADWCGFLTYDRLVQSPVVTWSTKAIAAGLMDNQEVTLGIISRGPTSLRQFLLVQKAPYNGYFFPVARVKTDAKPDQVAVEAVLSDTGYFGPVLASGDTETQVSQYSPRYNRPRTFRFHFRKIELPGVELNRANNPLEQALNASGVAWTWLTESQLAAPPPGITLSPTVASVRQYVIQAAGQG